MYRMAASEAERDFIYCTFDKEALLKDIDAFVAFTQKHKATVGQFFHLYVSSINTFDRYEQKLLPFLMTKYEQTFKK